MRPGISWLLLIVYMFVIFYFSSLPRIEIIEKSPDFFIRDKLLHILEYSILGVLSYNAFRHHELLNKKPFVYAIMFATIYGVTDELHQIFIPNRIFSLYDILANFFGSSMVLFRKLF